MPSPKITFLVRGEMISSKEILRTLVSKATYISFTSCMGRAAKASTSEIFEL